MKRFLIAGVIVLSLTGCAGSDSRDQSAVQSTSGAVYVVNYPLQYFAERISGGSVDVELPAPPHADPAFWMPDAETVAAYQRATLILLNGATYAKWVTRVSLPQARQINTSAAFSDQLLTIDGVVTHTHGPGGEHTHTGTAFTTWIDFSQAAKQAEAIKDAFVGAAIGPEGDLQTNLESLANELLALDSEITSLTTGFSDLPLAASHAVYDYFARRYNLNLRSVLWEPDRLPSDRGWLALEELLRFVAFSASRQVLGQTIASQPLHFLMWALFKNGTEQLFG